MPVADPVIATTLGGDATGPMEELLSLARRHRAPASKGARRSVDLRLDVLERALQRIYDSISAKAEAAQPGTRAEEWLLDNRHVVQETLQQVRLHLPADYLRWLPVVESATGPATLRVRELAVLLVRTGAKPLDINWLARAVDRYQSETVLTIGELWALPALLRLVVLQDLARDAGICLDGGADPELADRHVSEVAAAIISLRHLAAQDWRAFFEQLSRVERILRRDPAGAYAQMDFASRNRYRGAVEELARRCPHAEAEIAERAVARCAAADPRDPRSAHPGFYLIGAGRAEFERELGFRPRARRALFRAVMAAPSLIYFGLLTAFALPPLAWLAAFLAAADMAAVMRPPVLLLAAIPVVGLALALLNGLVAWFLPPRLLPKLDFQRGIPREYRTAVVSPVLFASTEDVAHLLERIEINHLSNPDPQLVYVVLGDLADAASASMPQDAELLRQAEAGIRALNARHARAGKEPFLLLHRDRQWNAAEDCWMGWERKRGKLVEFNRLLGGGTDTTFTTIIGDRAALDGVRYVITLDADTHMPPGAAQQLVGTLAHPLNRAVKNLRTGGLKAGYSILQPRVDIDPGSGHTRFAGVFAGDTTLDLYTHASSDVYHDLFGEGIYSGKGIYDWRAFEHSLHTRIPDNALLSHDLLEGVHARVALASDIALFEQYPPNALTYMRRLHRWVRGDWQLLPWLSPVVPSAKHRWRRNPLSLIHQWKIVDNLRRSLQPPALMLLFWCGWLLLPGSAWLWTLICSGLLAAPLVAEVLGIAGPGLARPRSLPGRLRAAPAALRARLDHWLLSLVLLPYESMVVTDAIVRTLLRLLVTRRRMLEWTAAAHVQRRLGAGLRAAQLWREMWVSPVVALLTGVTVAWLNSDALAAAVPLLLLWLLAPQVAWWSCQPLHAPAAALGAADVRHLRRLARRTWLFFERFIGPDDHWLPPDNFQEEPKPVLARRTSPTNIGMSLVATLAAWDFGYLDPASLVARLRNTVERMGRLERYRGHWLNWYETRDLRPLQPRYVSTVDSGNLAASFIVVARGLEEVCRAPFDGRRLAGGMRDTLLALEEALLQGGMVVQKPASLERLHRILSPGGADSWQWIDVLHDEVLPALRNELMQQIESGGIQPGMEELNRFRTWLDELQRQAINCRRYVDEFVPWTRLLARPPAAYLDAAADSALAARFHALAAHLSAPIALHDTDTRCRAAAELLRELEACLTQEDAAPATADARRWNHELAEALARAGAASTQLDSESQALAARCDGHVAEMDFTFLYDKTRDLFRIGYNVTASTADPNHYDLLASEARLAGFLAAAKGDVPPRHWLHLARPFRRVGGATVLMSWGATLFEYLMPRLFMLTPQGSLLDHACRNAISVHRQFASRRRLPWGISESGYHHLDSHSQYQYRAFGVPGIGFRRDLGDRLVVAPYASVMALPFDAKPVLDNLRRFEKLQMLGQYGLYEAVDFGRVEKTAPRRARIVRSYMSHHQGMLFAALDNFLNDDAMLRRFHSDPRIAGAAMLLHERLPTAAPAPTTWERQLQPRYFRAEPGLQSWPETARAGAPAFNQLSNGHYSVTLSATGAGGSQWDGIALTRWQCDATRSEGGFLVHVRDQDDGRQFALGREAAADDAVRGTAEFGPHMSEYQWRENALHCRMRIAISSQHDIEVRKLTLRNESDRTRRVLVAGCAEVALAPPQDFERHPAFARLFVESRLLSESGVLLFRRRPRSSDEHALYLAHTVLVSEGADYQLRWETDRDRFIGRGGDATRPRAVALGLSGFSNSTGALLDSVMASGIEIVLQAHQEVKIAYLTSAGRARGELLATLESYRSMPRVDWIFEQAQMQTRQELHNLEIAPHDVREITQLMSAVLAPRRALRARDAIRACTESAQPLLWSRGISGDRPILLVDMRGSEDIGLVEQLLKAHTFWAGRQLPIDLVILDEESAGYAQPGRDRLQQLIAATRGRTQRKLAGAAIVVPGSELQPAERAALLASARVVIDAARAPWSRQLAAEPPDNWTLPVFVPTGAPRTTTATSPLSRAHNLSFDNGLGGFSADGREYVLHLEPGSLPPAPWSNVLANARFGSLLTESGGCTWSGNSSEQRLTPWANDAVCDRSGEVLYLRDEETGHVWSPTPRPRPDEGDYEVRHGAGYTEYRHHSQGLRQALRVFVDPEAPIKLCELTLSNEWPWTRRLTATYFCEWVLGGRRAESAPFIACDFDAEAGALLARNFFSRTAGTAVAFLSATRAPHGFTADRTEFLGHGGDTDAPAAMFRIGLSGCLDPGVDPCAAYQVHFDLAAGATESVFFVLGEGRDRGEAVALARRFRADHEARASWQRTQAHWRQLLDTVQVETPEPAMDVLLNQWLPYQLLACRLLGRTAYYQSSGAFGFRDQLQDVMALVWAAPDEARKQIVRAARRQFQDGDVLHWWHDAPLRGVRTRCSDDLLWLPFVTAHYLRCTGDHGVLGEILPYLAGTPLERDEAERYAEFAPAAESGSLYEHCCRAIERATTVGPHGLPTIGSGDWNDGMNRVSTTGRGESVWLAWFLARVCDDFAPVCEQHSDDVLAARYRELAGELRARVEDAAWDGRWYRRGYYDDGTPLGSAQDRECRIDLIAQAWSVLGAAQVTARAREAMQSAWELLVREQERLILLLAPPFDRTDKDPGYIKGYPPGIRENGGQYTHAAAWAVWAAAGLDDGDRAMQMFRLLNPVLRTTNRSKVDEYRVEPYVLAGDIYGAPPHAGRGGWTWYTGAAGWLYRAGLEALLGLQRRGDAVVVNPCLPAEWKRYRVQLRRGNARYDVTVENPHGLCRGSPVIRFDGQALAGTQFPFVDDGRVHAVAITLAPLAAPAQAAGMR